MIACYFRCMNALIKEPSGFIGFAVARNKYQLFWVIDQYTNPLNVEIKKVHTGSYCKLQEITEHGDEIDVEISELEFDLMEPLFNDDGWKKPNWKGVMTEEEEYVYKFLEGEL